MSDMTRDSAVEELHRGLAGHVESGAVPGLAWLVAHGEVRLVQVARHPPCHEEAPPVA